MGADAKRALICGVSGQEGAYLAGLLVEKGYTVFGASRDAQLSGFHNLPRTTHLASGGQACY